MKLPENKNNKIQDHISPRIKDLDKVCKFDLKTFFEENKDLVKKFIKKDTLKVKVHDWDENVYKENWWYKNREGILRANISGIDKHFSTMQKLEWIKCALDVVYFTKKYIKIISIDDGIIPFDLYDYQEDLLELFQNNRFVLSMQARQSGKTQTTASFINHFSIFSDAKNIAVLANKAEQAQEIIERIQLSYEMLPLFLQPGVKVYNKRTVLFGNNSKVFSASSSSNAVRGKSIALLYVDEAAFLPNDIQFYESTYPTIASGKKSRIIISSTPNGTRGMFYKLWQESVNKVNSYVNKLVTWDMVPGRDNAWKKETIANTSEEQFRQEHECIFRGSVGSLISGAVLERIPLKSPIEVIEDLKIYSTPVKAKINEKGEEIEKPHMYVVIVDCSEGIGQDYHTITVVDVHSVPYDVVAVYRNNKLSSLLLPQMIHNIAQQYNNAYVLIEIASTGQQVATDLYYDLEYENVLMTISDKSRQTIGFSSNSRVGVKMSKTVKSIGCSTIKTMIDKGKIHLNDVDIVSEFSTFVPRGGSYAAAEGAHDDLAMGLVIFGWLSAQPFFVDLTDMKLRETLLNEMKDRNMDQIMPFGFIETGESSFDGESLTDLDGKDVFRWFH